MDPSGAFAQMAPSAVNERRHVCPEQCSAPTEFGGGKCDSPGDKQSQKKADWAVNAAEAGPKDGRPLYITDPAFMDREHGKALEFCGSSRFYTEISFPPPTFVPIVRAESEDVNVNPGARCTEVKRAFLAGDPWDPTREQGYA